MTIEVKLFGCFEHPLLFFSRKKTFSIMRRLYVVIWGGLDRQIYVIDLVL